MAWVVEVVWIVIRDSQGGEPRVTEEKVVQSRHEEAVLLEIKGLFDTGVCLPGWNLGCRKTDLLWRPSWNSSSWKGRSKRSWGAWSPWEEMRRWCIDLLNLDWQPKRSWCQLSRWRFDLLDIHLVEWCQLATLGTWLRSCIQGKPRSRPLSMPSTTSRYTQLEHPEKAPAWSEWNIDCL